MIEHGDGHIPRRQIHWVERPVGDKKRRKALERWRSSHRFLAQCCKTGQPISRIVVVGAALELLAWRSPIVKRTLRSISHRYYISDTEVNHIAHNLALWWIPSKSRGKRHQNQSPQWLTRARSPESGNPC